MDKNLDERFPNNGFPFQIEQIEWPKVYDHNGMLSSGGYTEWLVIYQNYTDPNKREIVHQTPTLEEANQWIGSAPRGTDFARHENGELDSYSEEQEYLDELRHLPR